jgi:DNA-directed RNA polymerase subunit RPC12/RpoP
MSIVRWLEASTPWLIAVIVLWVAAGLIEFLLVRPREKAALTSRGCPYCGTPWNGLKACSNCGRELVREQNHLVTRVLFSLGALATGPVIGIVVVHLLTGK